MLFLGGWVGLGLGWDTRGTSSTTKACQSKETIFATLRGRALRHLTLPWPLQTRTVPLANPFLCTRQSFPRCSPTPLSSVVRGPNTQIAARFLWARLFPANRLSPYEWKLKPAFNRTVLCPSRLHTYHYCSSRHCRKTTAWDVEGLIRPPGQWPSFFLSFSSYFQSPGMDRTPDIGRKSSAAPCGLVMMDHVLDKGKNYLPEIGAGGSNWTPVSLSHILTLSFGPVFPSNGEISSL